MPGISFRHAGVVVQDMTKSLEFYRDLLGLKVINKRRETGVYIDKLLGLSQVDLRWVKLGGSDGKVCVELLQYFSAHGESSVPIRTFQIGCSHIAFTVSALDRLYHELHSKGVMFTTEPLISPDGAVKVTFCQDPDGTQIELVEPIA